MQRFGFQVAKMLAALMPPKNLISLAKYMYLKNLLIKYKIDLVLDVGANVGQFAQSLRYIGYKGRIISFEPVSSCFRELAAAARSDPNWQVHNFALSNTGGHQAINIMADGLFSSFNKPSDERTTEFVDSNTITGTEVVELRTLRDVSRDLDLGDMGRVFLKCDTQGFDLHVLQGAAELLRSIPMLLVELSVTELYNNAPGLTEMLRFLESQGFAPVALFPINKLLDWSAVEFDYLGVNQSMSTPVNATRTGDRG
jgi:FkbM family methyltransferase